MMVIGTHSRYMRRLRARVAFVESEIHRLRHGLDVNAVNPLTVTALAGEIRALSRELDWLRNSIELLEMEGAS